MDGWAWLVGVIALAALTFFTALNLALRSPARARLAALLEERGQAHLFELFISARRQYVLATAVLRTVLLLVVVVCGLVHAGVLGGPLEATRTIITLVVVLGLMLIFGVALPSPWALYAGERLIVALLPLLAVIRMLCLPLIVALQLFDPLIRLLAGAPNRDRQTQADELEEEILHVVSEGERLGAVDEEEKEMIESVIELSDTDVEKIMTPRTDIEAIAKESDLEAVREKIRKTGHSRIPVFDNTIDSIHGVLYAKDLLRRNDDEPFELANSTRDALFVPETKSVRDLLREFQTKKVHIAIVLDEYGGTAGLVTIEDILEELVGEITDEYEPETPAELKRIDDHTVEVDARMRIDELNDELDIELPEDNDYETLGGFVFSTFGKIPIVGETCAHENVGIKVIAAEPRRVTRLRLTISKPS